MGAFGELLIKTMGGDLDSYRGNKSETVEPIEMVELTDDEVVQRDMEIHEKKMLKELRPLLDRIMYKVIDMNDVDLSLFVRDDHREYFKKWRDNRRRLFK